MDQEVRLKAATYGIPPVVHMVQGDNGRSLKMILEDFEVEDYYDCVLAVHRPDDSYYEIEALAIPTGNHVDAPAYQAITRPGKVECQLKVSTSGMLISTFDFVIMVHESVVGLPVEQLGYDIYDLIDAAQQIQNVGLTEEIKQALLDCFEHVAWTDEHGQDYVDALEAALYPPANLVSISAVYTQSGTVYDTDTLDSLRDDLVVTAHYDDASSGTVSAYTLSGTLTAGTSTITVSYAGKTDTFNVNVTHLPQTYTITNDLTLCTSNNNATTANENTSYGATITPNSGKEITSAVVTMGGVDVTASVYTSVNNAGVISIPSVTGNIVITVVCSTQNLFNKDTATSGAYLGTNGNPSASAAWSYSDYIAVESGKSYRMTTLNNVAYLSAPHGYIKYDDSKEFVGRASYVRGEGSEIYFNYTPDANGFVRFNFVTEYADDTRFVEVG